ncbi:hypothetical protein ESA2_CDS28 [Staphylococcus phage ESa2]|nr:hypothetical protein ESA2_CDS28 [Staphylococcus phage ESa2]
MILLIYTKEKELINMKLLNQENQIVISIATLESVKQALIWEYIDHIDNNILGNKIYDTEAVVITSDTLQSIKFAETMEDLQEYISDINWKLV